MPAWVKDHGKWDDAKAAFKKSYEHAPKTDSDWAIVTTIYKNMGGKVSSLCNDKIVARDAVLHGSNFLAKLFIG